jgi:hypothetical protein
MERTGVLKVRLRPTHAWHLSVHRVTIKVTVSVFNTSLACRVTRTIQSRPILVRHLRLVVLPAHRAYEWDIHLAPYCCRAHWVNGHLALEQCIKSRQRKGSTNWRKSMYARRYQEHPIYRAKRNPLCGRDDLQRKQLFCQ